MANRKNNISDNEVKNASGGYIRQGANTYDVYDDMTNQKVKSFNRTFDDQAAWEMAANYDSGYQDGKRAGIAEGMQQGVNQALDQQK